MQTSYIGILKLLETGRARVSICTESEEGYLVRLDDEEVFDPDSDRPAGVRLPGAWPLYTAGLLGPDGELTPEGLEMARNPVVH